MAAAPAKTAPLEFTPEVLEYYTRKLREAKNLPPGEVQEILDLMARVEVEQRQEDCNAHFLSFVRHVWPGFIHGRHHEIMADAFERLVDGNLKRLMIFMPPRCSKSKFGSIHLPAWYLGKYPDAKVIQASNTADLAVGFGREVRDLFMKPEFSEIFPGVALKADSKAAGRWSTNQGGNYFAVGTGGSVTGIGGSLVIIDDAHSEQEAKQNNPAVFDAAYEWYMTGPRQRLQPGARVCVIGTRWSKRDLPGRLIDDMKNRAGADQWEIITFPAILPSGESLWPDFWKIEELLATKASLPAHYWSAQYQQDPTSQDGAIIKKEWWKKWPYRDPPEKMEFVIQAWDTAFNKSQRADYSACTTWGVHTLEDGKPIILLLDAFKDKVEFPDLKKKAYELHRFWKPDTLIVEAKSSGTPLIQEMRRSGIPVRDYTPSTGQDKVARLNSVSDLFSSGMVYAPDARWAEEVIEEVSDFPSGRHDDFVDSVTLALMRFRKGGFIKMEGDEDEKKKKVIRRGDYY